MFKEDSKFFMRFVEDYSLGKKQIVTEKKNPRTNRSKNKYLSAVEEKGEGYGAG